MARPARFRHAVYVSSLKRVDRHGAGASVMRGWISLLNSDACPIFPRRALQARNVSLLSLPRPAHPGMPGAPDIRSRSQTQVRQGRSPNSFRQGVKSPYKTPFRNVSTVIGRFFFGSCPRRALARAGRVIGRNEDSGRQAGAMERRRKFRCGAPHGTRWPPAVQSCAGARRLPLETQAWRPVLRRPFSRRLSSRSTASRRTAAHNRPPAATGCRPASRPARACRRAGSRSGRRSAMPRRDRA